MKQIRKYLFACLFLQLLHATLIAGKPTTWHQLAYSAESYRSLDALRAAILIAKLSGDDTTATDEDGLTAAEILSAKLSEHENEILEKKLTQAIDDNDTIGWSIRKQTLLLRMLTNNFDDAS